MITYTFTELHKLLWELGWYLKNNTRTIVFGSKNRILENPVKVYNDKDGYLCFKTKRKHCFGIDYSSPENQLNNNEWFYSHIVWKIKHNTYVNSIKLFEDNDPNYYPLRTFARNLVKSKKIQYRYKLILEKQGFDIYGHLKKIRCNKCAAYLYDEHCGEIYGLHNATVTGGYCSNYLSDMVEYKFSLCEECLKELFESFDIKVLAKEYMI